MRDQGGKIKMSGKLKVKMCSRGGQERKRRFAEVLTLMCNQKGLGYFRLAGVKSDVRSRARCSQDKIIQNSKKKISQSQ